MPIYTFKCLRCGHIFDQRKSMLDNSLPLCEKCFSLTTEKIINPCTFILVGGGWSNDGYSNRINKEEKNR